VLVDMALVSCGGRVTVAMNGRSSVFLSLRLCHCDKTLLLLLEKFLVP